jgi:hypothetical protein
MKRSRSKKLYRIACVMCAMAVGMAPLRCDRAQAQVAPASTVDASQMFDLPALTARGRMMLAKAATAANGSAGEILARYDGHYMSLNARVKDGGGEFHQNWNDFLFVLDGEGTELTGGTVVDPVSGNDGEISGKRLEGATAHALHAGEFLHIPAGTPHQQMVAPGKTLIVLAIKVRREGAPALPRP